MNEKNAIYYSVTCEVCIREGAGKATFSGEPIQDANWKQCVGKMSWHFEKYHSEIFNTLKDFDVIPDPDLPFGRMWQGDQTLYTFFKNRGTVD
jgi:hypothetical protein